MLTFISQPPEMQRIRGGEGGKGGRLANSKLGRHFDSALEILLNFWKTFKKRKGGGVGVGGENHNFLLSVIRASKQRAPTSATRGNTQWEIASRYNRAPFFPQTRPEP